MKHSEYQPLWRQVIVTPIVNDKTDGGIFLPDSAMRKDLSEKTFSVIAKGAECLAVKEGDVIFIDPIAITHAKKLEFEDVEEGCYSIMEQQIIGKLIK